jgi:hypothetical protein
VGRRRLFALIGVPRAEGRSGWLWEAPPVENRRAVLSSAATSLEELLNRVTEVADDERASGDEGVAHDLYEVERALRTAHRRLSGLTRRMR